MTNHETPTPKRGDAECLLKQANNAQADDSNLSITHDFGRMSIFGTLPMVQPKLSINQLGDAYEQEADRMAEQVMQMPPPTLPTLPRQGVALQRKCAKCGGEIESEHEEDTLMRKANGLSDIGRAVPVANMLQRKCATCEAKEKEEVQEESTLLMRKGGKEGGFLASPNLAAQLSTTKSDGSALPTVTRGFMENAFGTDFSGVRVHTDDRAAGMSQGIQAKAFTHGQHIYFNQGEYAPETSEGKRLLAHELTHTIQQTGHTTIQRQEATGTAQEEATASARFIVEDEATPAPGQMTKTDFLQELNETVCSTVDAELQGTPYSSDNCPYIRGIFARHAGSSPAQIEQLAARYEPAADSAQSAGDLIQLILGRVRVAVNLWKRKGSLEDVPEDVSGMMSDGMAGSASTAPGNNGTSVQFNARPGGAYTSQSPQAVMQSLGQGTPLDSGTRSRMEGAFGTDFSGVQVHTDSHAAGLASGMNARAFAVGNHIAFAGGEHRPGTLVGDALMAHELAHTMQQKESTIPASNQAQEQNLEEDAENMTVGVIGKIFTGKASAIEQRIRTGVRLNRCKSEPSKRQIEIERLGSIQSAYLEEKRKKLEADKQREADEAAKKAGKPAPAPVKVTLQDTFEQEISKPLFNKGPADAWLKDISEADRRKYIDERVPKAWKAIIASVKGTELEKLMTGVTPDFQPEKTLKNGWYAWASGTKKLSFGMSFVHDAEADPKNTWPILAHEIGGHDEYGKTYASEIMNNVIGKMPKADQDVWKKDRSQEFNDRFNYPETEIYSALRQRRYSEPLAGPKPKYGAISPEDNIPDKLERIKDSLAPEVAKAVLIELKRRIDASTEILERDKKFYVEKVKLVFGYDI